MPIETKRPARAIAMLVVLALLAVACSLGEKQDVVNGRRSSSAPSPATTDQDVDSVELIALQGTEEALVALAQTRDTSDGIKVAYFGFSASDTFNDAIWRGVQDASAAVDIEATHLLGWDSADKQIEQMQQANADNQFDIYVLAAVDGPAIVPQVEQAISQGIAVSAVFNNLDEDALLEPTIPALMFVGQSAVDEGVGLAEMTIEACANTSPCHVAYLPEDEAPREVARLATFTDALEAAASTIVLLDADAGGTTAWDGRKAAAAVLAREPIVDVIVANSGAMIGVDRATQTDGRPVKLIGNGSPIEAVQAVRDGRWHGVFTDLPYDAGRIGVELGFDRLAGGATPSLIDLSRVGQVRKATSVAVGSFEGQWNAGN